MQALQIGDMKVSIPIIQGGMGVAVSLSGLASAVANEGGIGVISAAAIGMNEPDYMKNFPEANKRALRKQIRLARELTNGYLGVNIMMALSDHEALIKVALEEKIDIIIIGAGLPLNIPAVIANSGIDSSHTKLAVKVSSAKAARLIFQYWANKHGCIPDAVVVEGPMAGGHLGFKKDELVGELVPLDTLVRETVSIIKPFEESFSKEVPVIAAGGIYTGYDIFDIMQAGAKGVKMGTRFVTTHECDASPEFKESYISSKKEDITIIESPVGLPGRAIRNEFIEQIRMGQRKPFKCSWHCLSSCNFKTAPYCIAQALFNAARGNMEEGFAFSGTNGYKATKLEYTADVIKELIFEYDIKEALVSIQNNQVAIPL
jgi:NAD(P)H-dependent flavin oxidoreductase YrpB (nitropropane dioxygenase family)